MTGILKTGCIATWVKIHYFVCEIRPRLTPLSVHLHVRVRCLQLSQADRREMIDQILQKNMELDPISQPNLTKQQKSESKATKCSLERTNS